MRSPEALISPSGVLCIGSICADILARPVEQAPWGQTTWVDSIELNLGGNGGSASYTLSKLGIPVRLLSAIGQDLFGDALLNQLQSIGVDVSRVERSAAAPTASSVGLVNPQGLRALLHNPGASREAFPTGIELSPDLIEGCSRLHLANIFGMAKFQAHAPELLRQAQSRGLATSMDTAWDPRGRWMETLRPCLPYTDLLFMNEDEALHLSGHPDPDRAAQLIQDEGARDVVVKLGPKGCFVSACSERFFSSAFPVEALDTTGAGDCFVAGFLAALHRGFTFFNAARIANAVGAASVASIGAVTGVKSFEETLLFAGL